MPDRVVREVTRDEWIDLPIEKCYAVREDSEDGPRKGKVRYFEIIKEKS